MKLSILLPLGVFLEVPAAASIVLETSEGSLGLLPLRLDFVAILVPGILAYSTPGGSEVYVAVDEGVAVKTGEVVCITVRQAAGGTDLEQLEQLVVREFLVHSERDQAVRSVMVRLEATFLHRYAEFRHG